MNASLAKEESSIEHWEREAKDGTTNIIRVEKERDEAKQEARATQIVATSAGDSKARVEVDLTKALNSLTVVEEGEHRLEAKISRLEVKQVSLLLELEASKGGVSSLHARANKDKEDMVKDCQGSLELIFAYGYGCCAFKNNIYGDQPEIPDGMPNSTNPLPPKKFVNLRCPPSPSSLRGQRRRSRSRWGN